MRLRALPHVRCTLGVLFALAMASSGCKSYATTVHEAREQSCPDVVAHLDAVVHDARYAEVPAGARQAYERRVAECDLTLKKYEDAVQLARTWPDTYSDQRDEVVARGEAALGHEAETRAALESYVGWAHSTPDFLTDSTELARYASEEWFVNLGVALWKSGSHDPPLDVFARHFLRHATLPSLDVILADPAREPGEWIVWLGHVDDARLDRDKDQTLLASEGVDVREEVLDVDHEVRQMSAHRKALSGEVVMTVQSEATTRTYREVFAPNGRKFFVRYPKVSERLAGLREIVVLGRYEGRDGGDGPPVVQALAVVERRPRERTGR